MKLLGRLGISPHKLMRPHFLRCEVGEAFQDAARIADAWIVLRALEIDRGFPKESSEYLVNGRMPEQTKYIMKNEIRLLEDL